MNMRDIISLIEGTHSVLTEGRDAPLFHFTSFLTKALAANTLSPGDNAGGGISLTRNIATPFYSYHAKNERDCLVLNQAALARRFRMEPMYGDSPEKLPGLMKKHADAGIQSDPSSYEPKNEQEERLFGVITPLNRYLLAIVIEDDILDGVDLTMEWLARAADDSALMKVMVLGVYSKQHGIPLVERRSIKPNGTWSADVSKPIRAAAAKIARRHAKDLAKAEKAAKKL
jgi:hypothetical protein